MHSKPWRHAALIGLTAAAVQLAACGGGGGGAGVTPPPTAAGLCTGSASFGIVATANAVIDKNVAAAVVGCSGAIASPQWTQTGGPANVSLLSAKTQTISFEPATAGTYTFNVAFTDPNGAARSEAVSIDVAGRSTASLVVARASHSVRMGGNVSVRAWPQVGAQSITWSVVEGPAVTLNTADPNVAIFTAPSVARDTPMRLRATLVSSAGATDTAEVMVLVERHTQAADNDNSALWSGAHVSRVYPYRATSPYAGALVQCAYDAAQRDNNLCALSRLPFLTQTSGGAMPSVDQVMDRVLVSHDWLGANFENFLRTQDTRGDFRRMLQSVTAIVLGTHVRPSFYYAGTGAIYLDADNLWLTPAERDLVSEVPDFRSDFDRDLAYSGLWRYVQNNRSIFTFFDPASRVGRDTGYLLNETGWLMYHELGHALDFLPPSAYASLNSSQSAWGNIAPRFSANQLTSDVVPTTYPLASFVMRDLAQVKFQGVTATPLQRTYSPSDVGGFFAADLATDEYNYSTPREDIAMTLEELLMNRRLGYERDVAMTDKITSATTGSTLFVRWGQRGRIGTPAIRPRATMIAQSLVPWFDAAGEVAALPAPLQMRSGDTWNGNLVLPGPLSAAERAQPLLLSRQQRGLLAKEMRRVEHHLHIGRPGLPDMPRPVVLQPR
jgi:hypothetical protein